MKFTQTLHDTMHIKPKLYFTLQSDNANVARDCNITAVSHHPALLLLTATCSVRKMLMKVKL